MNPEIDLKTVQNIFKKYGLAKYSPKNIELYRQALRNKTVVENILDSNERMEFVGDCIINTAVGVYLYNRFPEEQEGFLTKLRIKIVKKKMLAELAETLGIKKYIQVDSLERLEDLSVLEDAFEAFVGSIYQDQGDFNICQKFIVNLVDREIDMVRQINQEDNYKEKFQNYYYQLRQTYPRWEDLEPVRHKEYGLLHAVGAKDANGNIIGIGYGKKKVDAAQQASKNALIHLGVKCGLENDEFSGDWIIS